MLRELLNPRSLQPIALELLLVFFVAERALCLEDLGCDHGIVLFDAGVAALAFVQVIMMEEGIMGRGGLSLKCVSGARVGYLLQAVVQVRIALKHLLLGF